MTLVAQQLLFAAAAAAVVVVAVAAAPPSAPERDVSRAPRKLHGRFLHITDLHPDQYYKPHTVPDDESACHRGRGSAGVFGAEKTDCDSPYALVNATFDWIDKNLQNQVDFVIWTGDSARHDSDLDIPRTRDEVLTSNRDVAHRMAKTFVDGMGIPVIPTFGNNDILPHNVLLPGPNRWLSTYESIWTRFIPPEQRHVFQHGGWFYVEVIPRKLAVFSLNTMYFFDRNAGVNDCVNRFEPGFQHMEWLRVQLDRLRAAGMKAILMGHVPPARTLSKQNWDESCWQKYTLWLRQYRDIIAGSVFGHMNIDHFMLQDTHDIDFERMTPEWAMRNAARKRSTPGFYSDEPTFDALSAATYLHELRDIWAGLPSVKFQEDALEGALEAKDPFDKIGGRWAERYQVSMVGPSIIPNYFPTLRIIEYNISGLDNHSTWADALENPDLFMGFEVDDGSGFPGDFTLHGLDELEIEALQEQRPVERRWSGASTSNKKKHGHDKKKKPTPPNFTVPDAPPHSAPPGPAYSPQPFTFVSVTQYYANLTYINNEPAPEGDDDKDRKKKHSRPEPAEPREFAFQIEYVSRNHSGSELKLKDYTVPSMLKIAQQIGQGATKSSSAGRSSLRVCKDVKPAERAEKVQKDKERAEEEMDNGRLQERTKPHEGKYEINKKKKNNNNKKKKKHGGHAHNKAWIEFVRRAFVDSMTEDELQDFSVNKHVDQICWEQECADMRIEGEGGKDQVVLAVDEL